MPGPLTTAAFAARLPSLRDLARLLQRRIAIVGSGGSLEGAGWGASIDNHSEVARFNDVVINAADTGARTTIHVVNRWVRGTSSLPLFDLELVNPWDSYCWRFHRAGRYAKLRASASLQSPPVFLIRPSTKCGLRDVADFFTRGFMFYWLVGSLFQETDLYGFVGSSTAHYGKGDQVTEPYLHFEHLVYRKLKELHDRQKEASLLSRTSPPRIASMSPNSTRLKAILGGMRGGVNFPAGHLLNMFPWPEH